jgi:fluoride exporter
VTEPLLVALGAAVGAPCRYLLDRYVQARHDSVFPWGTLLVNVGGSFGLGMLLALLAAGSAPDALRALLGAGALGAFTTYSTFAVETVRLVEDGAVFIGLANAVASVLAGLVAVAGGYQLGAVLV